MAHFTKMRIIAILILFAFPAHAHDFMVRVDRFIDADTFDGRMEVLPGLTIEGRFRLMCIDAPESRGKRKSPEGVAMSEAVKEMRIQIGMVRIYKKDAFGRWLVFFRPTGWEETLNRHLLGIGAAYYRRLTRSERAMCEAEMG